MLLDTQETFATAQSVAAAAGDVVSTNVYDTGAPADVGTGENIYLYAKMNAALVGVGASLTVVLQDSADNATFADVQSSKPAPTATAIANYELVKSKLPLGLRRYLRVVFRISGATTTAGTASAYLVKDVQANTTYPSAFTVA